MKRDDNTGGNEEREEDESLIVLSINYIQIYNAQI